MTAQQAAIELLSHYLPEDILSAMEEYELHPGERGYREHYKRKSVYRDFDESEQENSQRATADQFKNF